MAPTIHVNPATLEFEYQGPAYDVQVFNRQDLIDAVEDAGNEGKRIMVRAGDYGGEMVFHARRSVMTTVRAWPGDTIANFGPVGLDASFLTVQGFDMPNGGFDTMQTGCHHVVMLDNYIHDCAATALALWAAIEGVIDHDITFERNHVKNLIHLGEFFQGYGVVSRANFDQFLSNIRVAYNTFDTLQADGSEMAAVDGLEWIGNDCKFILPPPDPIPDPHPDGLMMWAGTSNAVVKDNRFVDVADTLMSGSTHDVLVENNLIARTRGRGIDGGRSGSSDLNVELYTFKHNTVYDCLTIFGDGGPRGFGCVSLTGDTPASGATNILTENLFGSLDYWDPNIFDLTNPDFGHNAIQNGLRPHGTDIGFNFEFADLVDYLPVNLPAGYEDCGYRRVACGHLMQ